MTWLWMLHIWFIIFINLSNYCIPWYNWCSLLSEWRMVSTNYRWRWTEASVTVCHCTALPWHPGDPRWRFDAIPSYCQSPYFQSYLLIYNLVFAIAASGQIRAAIGKANLLVNKKFKQFRGLCNKNLVRVCCSYRHVAAADKRSRLETAGFLYLTLYSWYVALNVMITLAYSESINLRDEITLMSISMKRDFPCCCSDNMEGRQL